MDCGGYKDSPGRHPVLPSTNSTTQTISFQGSEDHWSSRVVGNEVLVEVGPTDHTSGSSAITTRNITNYPWDQHYLPGNMVAQHCSGDYLAYAIKAPQKTSGMVRIIHSKSGDRGLVKNIRGMLRDLAFAHIPNRVILAFTDQFGTLYVVEVTDSTTAGSLNTEMLLEVNSRSDQPSDHHRVIWCPYIPDEQASGSDDADDPAYLLVLTHGPCAEIWNVGVVVRDNGGGQVRREQVTTGYQLMEQHSEPITDAAFSPDGTALATAALDGYVKFFQVYMADEEKSPRCLHQWNPHDGKPLSALFFLDNHKHHSPDVQFWKYAVTGACNNSELRVWSCESWQCHQTLRFVPTPQDSLPTPLAFKAAMDPTANFLMLSDIHRKMMYVIVVYQDGTSSGSSSNGIVGGAGGSEGIGISGGNCCVVKGTTGNSDGNNSTPGTGGSAQMVSVSELPVQYPALSLAITDAAWKNYKRWKHDHTHDTSHNDHEEEECDDGAGVVEGVVVRCVLINTKSLQEATLRFQPDVPLRPHTLAPQPLDLSLSHDSLSVRDGLTDLSLSMSTSEVEGNSGDGGREGVLEDQPPPPPPPPDALTSPQSSSIPPQHSTALHTPPASQQPPMNLLTPDSFSSPRKPEDSDAAEEGTDEGSSKVTPVPGQFEVPYASEFENAALSLLLRCGSGTLMQSSDTDSSASLKILGSVVAGTSTSPPATTLPPPPPSPLPQARPSQSKEDGPLATSEVGSGGCVGRLGTSTTSSPSLEVQQILHSQNGKSEEYGDEEEEEEDLRQSRERELAEDEEDGDDEEEEEEEEEEEPEALRQPLPPSQAPPQSETQPLQQPPLPNLVKPPASLPQPPAQPLPQLSASLSRPPSTLSQPPSSLPQPPPSLPQPPSSLPQPPSSIPQPPSSLSQPPLSLPQPPSSLPQPPSSLQQPPSSLPQPPSSHAQSPSSLAQPPSSLPQAPSSLPQPPCQLSASTSQPAPSITQSLASLAQLTQQHSQHEHKAAPSPLDVFASVRSLPTQLTCAQLEAEIKAGTVSPDSSGSAGSASHAGVQGKRARGFNQVRQNAEQANRNPANPDHSQINGPVTPG